jgi:S1-C subfamily serine protease
MKKHEPATEGRVNAKKRDFVAVVEDLKNTVYSVVRVRPQGPNDQVIAFPLGSGFFVSADVFLTCNHVLNSSDNPHQEGDAYQLVNEYAVHTLTPAEIGDTVHLYPDLDLALMLLKWPKKQAYVALEYGNIRQGAEIGIAGYPLPTLSNDENGQIRYDGLVSRVARNVVTAVYSTRIEAQGIPVIPNIEVIEVNFLFVSGNSGGPIFDASTGRVCGFVHGYRASPVNQRILSIPDQVTLPEGMSKHYVESLHAIYSIGIKINQAREKMEGFGVTL